ncbi:MAG TPA: hypothetical protein VNL71_24865, partial [Chloroflexota bacterium]|nr:hypothetical protein [Chloroflexota bacterium]
MAVPMTARLGRMERRVYHRRQLADLETLAVENAAAQFSLEAIESLVGTVRQLQAVVRQQLDNRADAAVEADRLCVLLQ